MVRLATPSDAGAILKIYTPYIVDTNLTFEITPPSLEEFSQRLAHIAEQYPLLVYQDEAGSILGYAYASRFRERAAYDYTVSVSVYVDGAHHTAGVGTALYERLLALLRRQNYLVCIAIVTLPNKKSVNFHKKFGFTEIGTFPRVGYKLNAWHDVLFLDKHLGEQTQIPKPIIPMARLDVSDLL